MLLEEPVYNSDGFYGRHCRYASVGGHTELPSEVVRGIKRTYSEGSKDPLKRFEYLRNGKATSVMIRATPNAVRWDEINRVQYRFQALNFHSDVLEALIHNSPPLSRREQRAATVTSADKNEIKTQQKDTVSDSNNNKVEQEVLRHNNNGSTSSSSSDDVTVNNNNKKEKRPTAQSRLVTCLQRSNSFDNLKRDLDDGYSKRKGSVVQIVTKDDTSDYNSDEDVFPNSRSENDSFDSVSYNTTICHVSNTGQIKDTARIQVTSYNDDEQTDNENMNTDSNSNNTPDLLRLSNRNTYDRDNYNTRNVSSAPPSTKVSITSPLDQISINDRFRSEILTTADDIDGEDLNSKSKEELVELVKSLQRELVTTKHYSLQRNHSPPLLNSPTRYRSRSVTPSCSERRHCCSRQDSINEEEQEESPNVLRLVENFEKKNDDDF